MSVTLQVTLRCNLWCNFSFERKPIANPPVEQVATSGIGSTKHKSRNGLGTIPALCYSPSREALRTRVESGICSQGA